MKKVSIVFVLCVVLSIEFFSGCTQQQSPPPAATSTITIQNFAFHPDTMTVKTGTNVTWTNEESVTHQIKIDTGQIVSPLLTNGQSFTYVFTTPGTFNYTCTLHSSMKGKIVVE